jgi:hypothetical protein
MKIYETICGDRHVLVREGFRYKSWCIYPQNFPEAHRKRGISDETAEDYIWVPLHEFLDEKIINQWSFE